MRTPPIREHDPTLGPCHRRMAGRARGRPGPGRAPLCPGGRLARTDAARTTTFVSPTGSARGRLPARNPRSPRPPARRARAEREAQAAGLLEAANNHRILRRGRKFGPKIADYRMADGEDRGLLFVCLNTDIARQFEFVQQTWLLNSDFATLFEETDPLVGPEGRMTIREDPLRRTVHVKTFVQMAGGDYFFLPSLPALRLPGNVCECARPPGRPAAGPAGLKHGDTADGGASHSGFRILRQVRPILRLGSTYVVTRTTTSRGVRHRSRLPRSVQANIDVITGGEPFFLGMADTPHYHAGVEAMRRVVRADDLPVLAERAEAQAEAIVSRSGGRWTWWTNSSGASASTCLPSISAYPRRPKGASTCGQPGCSSSSSPLTQGPRTARASGRDRPRAPRAPRARDRPPESRRHRERRRAGSMPCAPGGGNERVQRRRDPHRDPVHDRRRPAAAAMVVPQAMEQLLRRPNALAAAGAAALERRCGAA